MFGFEPINLDCATTDHKEMLGFGHVLSVLAKYAEYKGFAMRHRAAGRINEALDHENECERIYSALPQWARW